MEPVEDSLHVEVNWEVNENLKEHEQVPMRLQSEDEENSLFDEATVDTEQDVRNSLKKG